jgi:hypothetical protein
MTRLYRAWQVLLGIDETSARLKSLAASLEDARSELVRVSSENAKLKAVLHNIHELTG